MTAATHFVVGAALAFQIDNPGLALPLAFLSHFVIDVIPHHQLRKYNPWQHLKGKTKVIWDFSWPKGVQLLALGHLLLLILVIMIALQGKLTYIILAGGLIATSPDIYEWLRFTLGIPDKLPSLHFLHNEKSKSWDTIWGVMVQIVIFCVATIFLFI